MTDEPVKAEVPEIPDDAPSASEAGATSQEALYEGVEKRDMRTEVAGKETIFAEAKFLNSSKYEGSEFVVLLCKDIESGDIFTTSTGAVALVDKLHSAKFPFKAVIAGRQGDRGTFYVFEDAE